MLSLGRSGHMANFTRRDILMGGLAAMCICLHETENAFASKLDNFSILPCARGIAQRADNSKLYSNS